MRRFIAISTFVILFGMASTHKNVYAQLPKFKYLGGSVLGTPNNTRIYLTKSPSVNLNWPVNWPDPTPSWPIIVVKRYHSCTSYTTTAAGQFCCYTKTSRPYDTSLKDYYYNLRIINSNSEEVWESDITSTNQCPVLERPTYRIRTNKSTTIRIAERFNLFESPLTENQRYKFDFVVIDEKPTDTDVAGIYINSRRIYVEGIDTTKPIYSNLDFCDSTIPKNVVFPENVGTDKPVYCTSSPAQNTMEVVGNFEIYLGPGTHYVHMMSLESIGFSSVLQQVVNTNHTFTGHLYRIDDPTKVPLPECDENDFDLAACKISPTNTVTIDLKDSTNTVLATTTYNGNSFSLNATLAASTQVKLCASPVPTVDGGVVSKTKDKINASALVNNTNNCTALFNLDSDNSNQIYLGYNFVPNVIDYPQWYSVLNGNIFSGGTVNHPGWDNVTPLGNFTTHIANVSGSILAKTSTAISGASANSTRFTNFGIRMINILDSVLPSYITFPSASKTNWATVMPQVTSGASTFENKVYYVDLGNFQTWLAGTNTYTVTSTGKKLAVVFVNGAPNTTINITKSLKAATNDSKLLIIFNSNISVNFQAGLNFGTDAPTQNLLLNAQSDFDAAVIALNSTQPLSLKKENYTPPRDKTLVLKGLLASNNDVLLGWDREEKNKDYPSTHVVFDYNYLWLLSELDQDIFNSSGLTDYKIKWEILD